jgi:Winged helix-turn helix
MPQPCSAPLSLPAEQRTQLEARVRAGSTPQALVLRCRLVLRCAGSDRASNLPIAHEFGCHRHTVGRWRERFRQEGIAGLQDAPRSGRPRTFSPRAPGGGRHPGLPTYRRP